MPCLLAHTYVVINLLQITHSIDQIQIFLGNPSNYEHTFQTIVKIHNLTFRFYGFLV